MLIFLEHLHQRPAARIDLHTHKDAFVRRYRPQIRGMEKTLQSVDGVFLSTEKRSVGSGEDACGHGGVRMGGQSVSEERSGNSGAHAAARAERGGVGSAGGSGVQRHGGQAEE